MGRIGRVWKMAGVNKEGFIFPMVPLPTAYGTRETKTDTNGTREDVLALLRWLEDQVAWKIELVWGPDVQARQYRLEEGGPLYGEWTIPARVVFVKRYAEENLGDRSPLRSQETQDSTPV